MRFYYYMFYRFKGLHKYKRSFDSWMEATFLIGLIFLIHIMTILFLIQTIVKKDFINAIRMDNGLKDRFILFPLLVAPIFIILFIYYRINKEAINKSIENFKNETIIERRRRGRYFLYYLVISFLLLFSSILSPIIFK
jgi:H+/Cl- antiporter ClcA